MLSLLEVKPPKYLSSRRIDEVRSPSQGCPGEPHLQMMSLQVLGKMVGGRGDPNVPLELSLPVGC